MDILCVDQWSPEARIAVINHIPAIYSGALKTIVVREGGGIQRCCAEAIGEFDRWQSDGAQKFVDHASHKHWDEPMVEAWFDRLWPLQETILSDSLVFTVCDRGEYDNCKPPAGDPYFSRLRTRCMIDNLYAIAQSWIMYG